MRISKVILIRVLILEGLLTRVTLNLIVGCMYVPQMSGKLRGTYVFVTFLAEHFACKQFLLIISRNLYLF